MKKFNWVGISLLGLLVMMQINNQQLFPWHRGFDALSHLEYVNYLNAFHRIPLAKEGWELYQPPLYYLIASFIGKAESITWLNFSMWAIILVLVGLVTKGLSGVLVAGCLPVGLYLSHTVGNEFWATGLISLVMVSYIYKKYWLTGILMGLALLTKSTALVLLVSIVINELGRNKKMVLWIITSSVLISGWFYVRNLVVYQNPFIQSVDFSMYQVNQFPGYRDVDFFTDISGFFKMDLFQAHWYSLIPGTFFSFFYDGHNVIIPIQPYSKIGIVIVILSIPLFLLALGGLFRQIKDSRYRIMPLYAGLLSLSYVVYNLKEPFYSTVKGSFLSSLILPYVLGIWWLTKELKGNLKSGWLILLGGYVLAVIWGFWIRKSWY